MKRLGIACFALLAGCGEELKPFTVVDRLRIAAVANTPVQPAPGQIFEATMLTLRAPGDDTPLTVLGSGCVSQTGGLACGPDDPELAFAALPVSEVELDGDQPTGAREDRWQFLWPEGAVGIGLINFVAVNCALPDQVDTTKLAEDLEVLTETGEVPAPEGWVCAEDPLRLSRSVWLARHLITPKLGPGPIVHQAHLHPPLMTRTVDQAELDPGLIRTAVEAPMIGVPSPDEPRWFWFSTSPRGVVMRVTAAEKGANTALVEAERAADYSYWAVMRDEKGRVAWSTLRLRTEDVIEAP
ncbi:MAG: hypothetical protein VYB65_11085 [Myxococcota bacterium]|nr:hypothetical protein [Myxococcota bacterium]